ncbi:MAG TPA: EAL domain-containing protein [Acidimicrobiales bacterium]|nr:EAL domain-containing protein [Acidimicrobiales bacterium]
MVEPSGTKALSESCVLVVDDDPVARALAAVALGDAGIQVLEAPGGMQALDILSQAEVALVVLDNHMPGLSGLDVLRELRNRPDLATLPVILVTADDSVDDRVRGLGSGASDYITKPFEPSELVARVQAQMRSRDAWHELVDAHRRQRAAIAAALSDLDSEASPEDAAALVCAQARALGHAGVAVLEIAGNQVIPMASAGLDAWPLTVGRALPDALAWYVVDRTEKGAWIEVDDSLAVYPGGPMPGEVVLACAPMHGRGGLFGLLVLQLTQGRNRIAPSALNRSLGEAVDYARIAVGLVGPAIERRRAEASHCDDLVVARILENGDFESVFQPIIDLTDGHVVGYEALTRFHIGAPTEGVFAAANAAGVGVGMELATLGAAVSASWSLPAGFVSYNVSADFVHAGGALKNVLRRARRPVVLELTEHDQVADYSALRTALSALNPPVHVSVDDAGSGFASLRHVLELRPAFVKLDRSWVAGIDDDPRRQALVAGMAHFAKTADSRLIAEGVERPEELDVLQGLSVDMGQGFLLGMPEPADRQSPLRFS